MNTYVCLLCVHASGASGDQTPTAPLQPLRTAGDVQRTKDSVKGKMGKKEEGAEGQRHIYFQNHAFARLL